MNAPYFMGYLFHLGIWYMRRNKTLKVLSNYQPEGTLVHIIRAYTALYPGGTPSQKTGTSPPSCLLLDNHLYMPNKFHLYLTRTQQIIHR